MKKYEVRKVDVSAWDLTYAETLATASTWRELMNKESYSWYVGKGSHIFRDGELLGTMEDMEAARIARYNDRTGEQLPVRLRDFIEARDEKEY